MALEHLPRKVLDAYPTGRCNLHLPTFTNIFTEQTLPTLFITSRLGNAESLLSFLGLTRECSGGTPTAWVTRCAPLHETVPHSLDLSSVPHIKTLSHNMTGRHQCSNALIVGVLIVGFLL